MACVLAVAVEHHRVGMNSAGTERDNRLVPGPKSFARDDLQAPAVEFLWAAEAETEADETEKLRTRVRDLRKIEARWIARPLSHNTSICSIVSRVVSS